MYKKTEGFSLILVAMSLLIAGLIGFAGWRVLSRKEDNVTNTAASKPVQQSASVVEPSKQTVAEKAPDAPSTLESPAKVQTVDGKQYLYYGYPAGHNNASPKKVLVTIHGTGGNASEDYNVWRPAITGTGFALASLNWWDGEGDATSDYNTPAQVVSYIHDFLKTQGYTQKDTIVFEGFSRGSANSYSIVALDKASTDSYIDAAVSSSGGQTDAYFNMTTTTIAAKQLPTIYKGVYWILACGGKDPNPERDGCTAMQKSATFVEAKGATVLGILSDDAAAHGALNTSTKNLTKQMFDLITAKLP